VRLGLAGGGASDEDRNKGSKRARAEEYVRWGEEERGTGREMEEEKSGTYPKCN